MLLFPYIASEPHPLLPAHNHIPLSSSPFCFLVICLVSWLWCAVSDPLLIEWSSPMVEPAIPTYSFYVNPGEMPGQPGLAQALEAYDSEHLSFAAGEFYCFTCHTQAEWLGAFQNMFKNKYGKLRYASVYNLGPFLKSPGALAALKQFIDQA